MIISEEEYEKRRSYTIHLDLKTKYISLKPNSKEPSSLHGHLDGTTELPYSQNWGIVLDDLYIVVDFDSDHPERNKHEFNLPSTWCQSTARLGGMHYLYYLPEKYIGKVKNTKLRAKDDTILADIKVKGYIVGPGSKIDDRTYKIVHARRPHLDED